MPKKIKDILKPDEYKHILQFDDDDKNWINERINTRSDGEPGVECVVRGKNDDGDYFKLTPEEIIRQCYAHKLIDKIRKVVNRAHEFLHESECLYSEAEKLIDNEIGIDIDSIDKDASTIKSFSESFGNTGRLDAEYYQLSSYRIMDMLNAGGTIATLCHFYDTNFMPKKTEKYRYIELANVGKKGEIEDVDIFYGDALPTRARRLVKKGNIIVSSIEGSLSSCALITDMFNDSLCSTGFYVIDSEYYNSETLLVILKSKVVQHLLKRGCSGTILTNISREEFLNIPLPKISSEMQYKIRNIISDTYNMRNKGKELIGSAIHILELAIEQDEDRAMKWLEDYNVELDKCYS